MINIQEFHTINTEEDLIEALTNKDYQRVFDQSVSHLLAQMEKSLKPNSNCAYRGSNGKRCAIGWLLTEAHCEEFDRRKFDVYGVLREFNLLNLSNRLTIFMNRLQRIHDDYEPDEWVDKFKTLAEDYELVWKF